MRWLAEHRLEPVRRREPDRWDRAARAGALLTGHELIDTALGRSVAALWPG
jgi:hypothetical protein